MTYLDVWRSGTFLLYSCKAAFWIQEMSPRMCDVERSVVLRCVFAISSALAYLLFFRECATPPHIQVRHTTWLSFTRPSPVLVLQATNAGARRPGYEASPLPLWLSFLYTCRVNSLLNECPTVSQNVGYTRLGLSLRAVESTAPMIVVCTSASPVSISHNSYGLLIHKLKEARVVSEAQHK